MSEWIGMNNRELLARPLLEFRKSLQQMGLLRKDKARLLLTKAGVAARADVGVLWRHVAERLVPRPDRTFDADAGLLQLVEVAVGEEANLPPDFVTEALGELGWRYADGQPIEPWALYRLERSPMDVLYNVTDRPTSRRERRLSPIAVALARAALLAH
jgi:hypothetical protein